MHFAIITLLVIIAFLVASIDQKVWKAEPEVDYSDEEDVDDLY